MAPEELWKEVKGYEGLYLISNLGKIVSLPREVQSRNKFKNIIVHRKSKSIKTCLRGRNGLMYEAITLTKDGISKRYSVHRLVAEAFIPNPDNLPEVNHKDENPLNNCASNLEWCTRQYNIEYSKAKKVLQMKSGKVVGEYTSITNASKATGIKRTNINNALTGWSKTAGGFEWAYMN